jgi:hypothetical protein
LIGTFDIALPPGTYTVQVQSIDPGFTGGSSVGPLLTPIPMPGSSEYWNIGESATDDLNASSPITVVAGGTLTGIDIILNGTLPRFDPLDDCDLAKISRVPRFSLYLREEGKIQGGPPLPALFAGRVGNRAIVSEMGKIQGGPPLPALFAGRVGNRVSVSRVPHFSLILGEVGMNTTGGAR